MSKPRTSPTSASKIRPSSATQGLSGSPVASRPDQPPGLGIRARIGSLRVRIGVIVTVLVAVLVVTATVTTLARLRVAAVDHTLRVNVLPAQQAATRLTQTYVDQETAQRGYLITGDPQFLQPYIRGKAAAITTRRQLEGLLAEDAGAQRLLADVDQSAQVWQTQAATPEIAARQRGPISPGQLETFGLTGKNRFDGLRVRLADLEAWTSAATTTLLTTIADTQRLATIVTLVAVALALLVGIASIPLTYWWLNRPLQRLVTQIATVGAGDHDQHITPAGPTELVIIADSVERLRHNIVDGTRVLLDAEHQLTLRREQDRMATDLHDLTIQRVFGLGLALSSLIRRHPQLEADLTPLIAETDHTIRELRTVIFDITQGESTDSAETVTGVRAGVLDVTRDSARTLGFAPTVEFQGPIETYTSDQVTTELLAVLREALLNVARHAHATTVNIFLQATPDTVVLTVTDNGVGVIPNATQGDGVANMIRRARRFGGQATLTGADVTGAVPGGTTLRWQAPTHAP
jgi:signal transduction histidine kinase